MGLVCGPHSQRQPQDYPAPGSGLAEDEPKNHWPATRRDREEQKKAPLFDPFSRFESLTVAWASCSLVWTDFEAPRNLSEGQRRQRY
jgi:hypothetical protein